MYNKIIEKLKDKTIAILGFGKEGKSTYNFIRRHLPNKKITILDKFDITKNNDSLLKDDNIDIIIGEDYLNNLEQYDLIIKAPGIALLDMNLTKIEDKITSQLELILEINRKNYEVFNYEIEYNKYVELPNGKVIKEGFDEGNSNDICRLCSKEINLPLIIRNRRIGDKMKVKGLNGSKKIKDIFIDKKINSKERDLWPVVVDSTNNVVWLPGLKKSKYDKKKDEEYDIILKYE